MSRASQVIILCEDKLHRTFVTLFLKQYGYREHDFRIEQAAPSKGAAEHFVRHRCPVLLKTYRSRIPKTFLIAVIDADVGSVHGHEQELRKACEQQSVPVRQDEDKVVHVIPRRAINTWLASLQGVEVDEGTDYKGRGYKFQECESNIAPLVRKLHEACVRGEAPTNAPPSLTHACREFARIKDELR